MISVVPTVVPWFWGACFVPIPRPNLCRVIELDHRQHVVPGD